MLKEFLEEALEAEMEEHLSKERAQGNKRNGKGSKTVKSSSGELEIQTPQDRHSSFEPEIVRKRQRILADNLEDKIIGLYGLGTSLRDISAHIQEMYDTEISTSVLSEITDRIVPKVKAWQSRPLESIYCIVWLDAMFYKVREEGKVVHKALYNVLGVNKEGRKEVLGMYVSESEGANFWLGVLDRSPEPWPAGHPDCVHRRPERLCGSDWLYLPPNRSPELHRAPNPPFNQIRGQ